MQLNIYFSNLKLSEVRIIIAATAPSGNSEKSTNNALHEACRQGKVSNLQLEYL